LSLPAPHTTHPKNEKSPPRARNLPAQARNLAGPLTARHPPPMHQTPKAQTLKPRTEVPPNRHDVERVAAAVQIVLLELQPVVGAAAGLQGGFGVLGGIGARGLGVQGVGCGVWGGRVRMEGFAVHTHAHTRTHARTHVCGRRGRRGGRSGRSGSGWGKRRPPAPSPSLPAPPPGTRRPGSQTGVS
jgi:hypothetical protein